MRKSVLWVGMLLILVLVASQLYSLSRSALSQSADDFSLLRKALAATGAHAVSAEIQAWCEIADYYYSPREAEAAVTEMAEAFEISPLELKIILRSTGHYGYAVAEFNLAPDVWVRFQIQSLDNATVAAVELIQHHHRELSYRWQQVQNAVDAVNVGAGQVKITSCLSGQVNARLMESEKLNLVYAAFNAVQADYQQGTETGSAYVWSGYSPLFSSVAETARHRISFTMSIKTNKDSGFTVVRVATPVLPGSY